MKRRTADGDRLVLSGPPGGVGAVVLLLVVGAAMTGGGGMFFRAGLADGPAVMSVMGGIVALVGAILLAGGIGVALTRDRLELDRVTMSGRWTRRLLGRPIKAAVEFRFDDARHVRVERYVESTPRADGPGSTSTEMIRARLLLVRPRRAILLDEGVRKSTPRVQSVAEQVAEFLGLDVEASGDYG